MENGASDRQVTFSGGGYLNKEKIMCTCVLDT